MIPRIYIDTSVIGGVFDKEFQIWSEALFQNFIKGQAQAIISDLTLGELEKAPNNVKSYYSDLPKENFSNVKLGKESISLASEYLNVGTLSPGQKIDAQHIAIATVERVDVLVSWNFKHIVNLKKIRNYNSVNLRLGYPEIEIRTPREVVNVEERF